MTIWLDGFSIQEQFITSIDANAEITQNKQKGNRRKITVTYESSVTLDEIELNNLNRFLSAIGDGDPELELRAEDNYVTLSIIADEDVYRNEGF